MKMNCFYLENHVILTVLKQVIAHLVVSLALINNK